MLSPVQGFWVEGFGCWAWGLYVGSILQAGQQLGGSLRGPRGQPFRIFEDDVPVGRGRGEPEQPAGGALRAGFAFYNSQSP